MSLRMRDLEGVSDPDLRRLLMENLKAIVDHVARNRVSATTDTAEFAVPHGLGLVPTGYAVVGKSADVGVYDSGTAHDKTNLYLKATAAGVTITLDVSGGEVA